MAMSKVLTDREHQSYREASTNLTAVAVVNSATPTVYAQRVESAEITMAAGTTGAIATTPLFTVTGVVAVTLFAICTENLTSGGSATIEVGVAGSTAGLLPQVAFSALANTDIWHDNSPDAPLELASVLTAKIIQSTINYKIATATITGGKIKFFLSWYPISSDGNVVAA